MKQPGLQIPEAEDRERAEKLSEEWLSVEKALDEAKILQTIVFFGSARIEDRHSAEVIKDKAEQLSRGQQQNHLVQSAQTSAELALAQSRYYEDARSLARKIGQHLYDCQNEITKLVTGGGPGIMEAANRGASEIGQSSIGLNIIIPREQIPNPYVSEDLSFSFHYFSLRKMHFLKRAKAIIVFPGGFGTLDELSEVLTLIQTGRMPAIPIILYGRDFWQKAINFEFLAEQRLIDPEDLKLYTLVDDIESAFQLVKDFMKCGN